MDKMFLIEPSMEILPAKDDRIFKSLLTRDEPESKLVLMDLISSIIGYKVSDVVIKNNEPATTDINQKQERLDVNCVINDGEIVNIEMQASYMRDFFSTEHKNLKNRAVFYGCDLFSSQNLKGKTYNQLTKTYQITFVAYTIFPSDPNYKNEFVLRNSAGDILTNDLTIIFIELSKLKEILNKPVAVMTPLEMWSIFFEYVDNPNYRDIINELIRSKEEILMASTLLQSISQDDYEKARLLSRRKYENDLESNFNTAVSIAKMEGKIEGKMEGKLEGKLEASLELAKNLLDILDIETIAKKTGLSVNQVKRLNDKPDSK